MRIFALLIIMVSGIEMMTQTKNTNAILTYKVEARKTDYYIAPGDCYLFAGGKNTLKIIQKGVATPFTVGISNGKITKTGDSSYVVSGLYEKAKTVILYIKETGKNGKEKIVKTRDYKIIQFPVIECMGVKSDSAIDLHLLIAGRFSAYLKEINKRAKVVGFTFADMSTKEKKVTSSSNVLTPQMRDYLKNINKGAMLTFTDIKYLTPQGDTVTSPIYRVFTYESPKGYLMQL